MPAALEGGDDPRVGTTVADRYFVHRLLGRGGMGDVYEATRLEDDRPVALKLLRGSADGARVRRFEREAAALARLRHPNCIEIVDSGADGEGGFFLAMELVRGRDLARLLREDGPLPAARAGRVADQVLAVLERAHEAGVIHRDLKPANVVLDAAPDGADFAKVLDFGIAAFVDPEPGEARLTREGIAHGTPGYMSPEQIRGEPPDARTDLYAVGALLFEMLTGAPPFEAASPMAVAAKQLTEPAPPVGVHRADVPPAVAALVARALEAERALRPASAAAMREGLRAALEGVGEPDRAMTRALPPTEAFAAAHVGPARRRAGRAGRGGIVAAAAIAAAVIAAVPVAGRRGATRPEHAAGSAIPSAPAPAGVPGAGPLAFSAAPTATGPAPAGAHPAESVAEPRRAAAVQAPPARRSVSASAAASAAARAPPVLASPIRVVRGELDAVPTPPASTGDGVLVLQAAPWAVVSVAGAALGETPREVRLAAGSYEVRAVHPELGVREGRVAVRAGERTLWTATFNE